MPGFGVCLLIRKDMNAVGRVTVVGDANRLDSILAANTPPQHPTALLVVFPVLEA